MKSVLISIQPYYVFLIIAHLMGWNIPENKTVEVRKNFPVSPEWDRKVELYCSKDKKSFKRIPEEDREWMRKYIGKVACRFVCDKIDKMLPDYNPITKQFFYNNNWESNDWNSNDTCLSTEELNVYGKRKPLYGWHISDLKIYDKPKELGEFKSVKIIRGYHQKDEPKTTGINIERLVHSGRVRVRYLNRPPQSWCYVEEL